MEGSGEGCIRSHVVIVNLHELGTLHVSVSGIFWVSRIFYLGVGLPCLGRGVERDGHVCMRSHVFMLQLRFVNPHELGLGTRQRLCFGVRNFLGVQNFWVAGCVCVCSCCIRVLVFMLYTCACVHVLCACVHVLCTRLCFMLYAHIRNCMYVCIYSGAKSVRTRLLNLLPEVGYIIRE